MFRKAIEISRDIALVHQLEVELQNGEVIVLASASTTIWPKADIVRRDYVKRIRFEAKGGASVKQQDAKRQKMANGVVKKKKKPNKQEASKRDLKNILKTCKANGLSLGEITEIVSETF